MLADGRRYEGNFKDFKKEGFFKIFYTADKTRFEGNFVNDK